MSVHLTVISVHEVQEPLQFFVCDELGAKLSGASCVKRQALAHEPKERGRSGPELGMCRSCGPGRMLAERLSGKVYVEIQRKSPPAVVPRAKKEPKPLKQAVAPKETKAPKEKPKTEKPKAEKAKQQSTTQAIAQLSSPASVVAEVEAWISRGEKMLEEFSAMRGKLEEGELVLRGVVDAVKAGLAMVRLQVPPGAEVKFEKSTQDQELVVADRLKNKGRVVDLFKSTKMTMTFDELVSRLGLMRSEVKLILDELAREEVVVEIAGVWSLCEWFRK